MLFAGDPETSGWRSLLRFPAFVADLASVNVFVTSHHGRQNGCCEETFWVCRPQVFVVSDQALQWETQETTDWYRRRAVGVPDFRLPPDRYLGWRYRYVLTTRHDGTLTTWAAPNGNFMIIPAKGPSFDYLRRAVPLQLSNW